MHNLLVKDIFIRKKLFYLGKYTFYSRVATNGLSMQYISSSGTVSFKTGENVVPAHASAFPRPVYVCTSQRMDVSMLVSTIVPHLPLLQDQGMLETLERDTYNQSSIRIAMPTSVVTKPHKNIQTIANIRQPGVQAPHMYLNFLLSKL